MQPVNQTLPNFTKEPKKYNDKNNVLSILPK